MPSSYDPSPNPSPRSQAQHAFYQAIDSLNEARKNPSASPQQLEDITEAYETARELFRLEAGREAQAQAQAGPETETSQEAEAGQ